FHVRLSAANPHFANDDVADIDLVFALDGQCVGSASLLTWQFDHPFAVPGGRGNRFSAKRDGDFFAVVGPAPNQEAHALLQNHVVGKQAGQPDVRAGHDHQ